MARFSYNCKYHGVFTVSLEKREKRYACPQCGQESIAIIKSGSISIMESLDNGAMARKVERLHNIEEIMDERSTKHEREVLGLKEEGEEE
jgi:hypothetical protein